MRRLRWHFFCVLELHCAPIDSCGFRTGGRSAAISGVLPLWAEVNRGVPLAVGPTEVAGLPGEAVRLPFRFSW